MGFGKKVYLVIKGTLVQLLSSVLLSSDGGRQVNNNHLEHGFASGQPVPHDAFHQRFAFLLKFLMLQFSLDVQFVEKLVSFFLLEVHDGVEDLVNGVQNVHAEGAGVVFSLGLGPFLGLGVEEVLA